MEKYIRKSIYSLMVIIVIFCCIFLISFSHYLRKSPVLGIGMGYEVENIAIMLFSFLAIIRAKYEIIRIRE